MSDRSDSRSFMRPKLATNIGIVFCVCPEFDFCLFVFNWMKWFRFFFLTFVSLCFFCLLWMWGCDNEWVSVSAKSANGRHHKVTLGRFISYFSTPFNQCVQIITIIKMIIFYNKSLIIDHCIMLCCFFPLVWVCVSVWECLLFVCVFFSILSFFSFYFGFRLFFILAFCTFYSKSSFSSILMCVVFPLSFFFFSFHDSFNVQVVIPWRFSSPSCYGCFGSFYTHHIEYWSFPNPKTKNTEISRKFRHLNKWVKERTTRKNG